MKFLKDIVRGMVGYFVGKLIFYLKDDFYDYDIENLGEGPIFWETSPLEEMVAIGDDQFILKTVVLPSEGFLSGRNAMRFKSYSRPSKSLLN